MNTIRLSSLHPGKSGIIEEIKKPQNFKRRLQDIGFTKGTTVLCVFKSPFGDPIAYKVKSTTVALRESDASDIYITPPKEDQQWV